MAEARLGKSNRGLSFILWTVLAASAVGMISGAIELAETAKRLSVALEALQLWKRAVIVGGSLSSYGLMIGLFWWFARGVWKWEREAGRSGAAPKV